MAFQKEHVLILSTYKWRQLHSTTKIALCHQTPASGLPFPMVIRKHLAMNQNIFLNDKQGQNTYERYFLVQFFGYGYHILQLVRKAGYFCKNIASLK